MGCHQLEIWQHRQNNNIPESLTVYIPNSEKGEIERAPSSGAPHLTQETPSRAPSHQIHKEAFYDNKFCFYIFSLKYICCDGKNYECMCVCMQEIRLKKEFKCENCFYAENLYQNKNNNNNSSFWWIQIELPLLACASARLNKATRSNWTLFIMMTSIQKKRSSF